MRFNEAKKSIIRVFVVVPASDPEHEAFVFDRNGPAPISSDWIQSLKPFSFQTANEKLSKALAVATRVDVILLAFVGTKIGRSEFHTRFHGNVS